MLLTSLDNAHPYEHIFIAPHLDDAVLSCGGLLTQCIAHGKRTLVVTLCTGSPPSTVPLSPFASYLHTAWNLGADPMALRRQEDLVALTRLGVDGMHMGELDAIYRDPAYATWEDIIATVVPTDPLPIVAATTLTRLRQQNPVATLYLPLAVGNHVDHQVVCAAQAAVELGPTAFYEDFPYAIDPDAVAKRRAALSEFGQGLVPHYIPIGDYLPRKVDAIRAYSSQLGELFPTVPMEEAVRTYATAIGGDQGPCERLWLSS